MSDFEPHHISPISGISGFASPLAQGGGLTPTLSYAAGSAGKRRKVSKTKISPILKRAVSTPQMAGLGDSDSGGLSPSALDKRRNKLGYQRISIACGHCRRRKIRCVIAEQDDHGRCQNCIRLKKECVFYPVDSAGGPESRAQQKSGAGSKSSSVISNSPSDRKPTLPTGESERDFGRFPPLASNAPSDHTSLGSGGGLGISNAGSSIPSSEFSFESGVGTRDGWHSGMFQQADSISDASTAGSWRVQDSPRMSGFPAYPSSDGQPGAVYSNYHYPPTRGEYGMQPPLRSMSYGNIEPSISFQQAASTNSLEYTRQSSASHYTIPSTDASHTPTTSSVLDSGINPAASESMPSIGMYSPQWSYYQQNPQSVGMDYARHDSAGLQWYQPGQMGHEIEDPSRQHYQQQQHWQQQQHHHHHHLMPPPGSGYKGHSPG